MKKVPRHRSEDKERAFWSKADSTGYIDWERAKRVTFSNLKPSLRTICLRLPEMMIEELKLLANKTVPKLCPSRSNLVKFCQKSPTSLLKSLA
jgi:hypothetical protein